MAGNCINLTVMVMMTNDTIYYDSQYDVMKKNIQYYEYNLKYGDVSLYVKHGKKDNNNDNTGPIDSGLDCVQALSSVLINESDVFKAMLTGQMKEKETKDIYIACNDISDIDNLLYFIIVGEFKDNTDVYSLIDIANLYGLNILFKKCLEYIINNVNMDTIIKSIQIIEKYLLLYDDVLISYGYKMLFEYTKKNSTKIKKMENVNELNKIFKILALDIMK